MCKVLKQDKKDFIKNLDLDLEVKSIIILLKKLKRLL